MDNLKVLDTESTCSITLTEYQHAHYHQTAIKILAPDGVMLKYIGEKIDKEIIQSDTYQLRDEIHLVACLISCIDHDIELPRYAVSGLSDLINRMQRFCDKKMG